MFQLIANVLVHKCDYFSKTSATIIYHIVSVLFTLSKEWVTKVVLAYYGE